MLNHNTCSQLHFWQPLPASFWLSPMERKSRQSQSIILAPLLPSRKTLSKTDCELTFHRWDLQPSATEQLNEIHLAQCRAHKRYLKNYLPSLNYQFYAFGDGGISMCSQRCNLNPHRNCYWELRWSRPDPSLYIKIQTFLEGHLGPTPNPILRNKAWSNSFREDIPLCIS